MLLKLKGSVLPFDLLNSRLTCFQSGKYVDIFSRTQKTITVDVYPDFFAHLKKHQRKYRLNDLIA